MPTVALLAADKVTFFPPGSLLHTQNRPIGPSHLRPTHLRRRIQVSFQSLAATAAVQAKIPHGRPAVRARPYFVPEPAVRLATHGAGGGTSLPALTQQLDSVAVQDVPRQTYAGAGAYY